MKLINQSFEIINQTDFSLTGIKKFIERCGRVCYKSEDNITEDSCERFINMLIKLDHSRPLEFGTVHLRMSAFMYDTFLNLLINREMLNQIWIKAVEEPIDGDDMLITTNYRYYLDIIKAFPQYKIYFTEEDNKYYPKRYTVHFITNRVTMDSIRTHVSLSHLGESTRYCNYSKDKFNNELTFIKPCWMKDLPDGHYAYWDGDWCDTSQMKIMFPGEKREDIDSFLHTLQGDEYEYILMINSGKKPQEARDILPFTVKAELISCGFKDAWDNFFYRRCANDAHPMARELATKLKDEFNETNN